MGWETLAWCEWNEFGQKVLRHHFPNAEGFGDITKTDFTKYANRIDILTGGFPCQPYSLAGKRLGKEDDRHLWPEMLRAIREIQPTYVVGENVFGIVNWNGELVFNEVQADLEAEGYEVQPFVLPACAVNAPHRRDRVWFVAYSSSNRRLQFRSRGGICDGNGNGKNEESRRKQQQIRIGGSAKISNAPNPDGNGQQRGDRKHEVNASQGGVDAQRDAFKVGEYAADTTSQGRKKREQNNRRQNTAENRTGMDDRPERLSCIGATTNTNSRRQSGKEYGQTESGWIAEKGVPNDWQNFPTQPPVCVGDDGLSSRLDGITFSKWRNESIKAAGNAIVPQVAFEIFKAIQSTHNQ
jgi:DNA (cytosine-5)-methyltransferase 1